MLAVPPDAKPSVDASAPLKSSVPNFYMTDCITRASTTMASCVEAFGK